MRQPLCGGATHFGAQFPLLRKEAWQSANRLAGTGQRGRGDLLRRAAGAGLRRADSLVRHAGGAAVARERRIRRAGVQGARHGDQGNGATKTARVTRQNQDRVRSRRRNQSSLDLRHSGHLFRSPRRCPGDPRSVRSLRQGDRQPLSMLVQSGQSGRGRLGARVPLVDLVGVHRADCLRVDWRRRSALRTVALGQIG